MCLHRFSKESQIINLKNNKSKESKPILLSTAIRLSTQKTNLKHNTNLNILALMFYLRFTLIVSYFSD